MRGGRDDGVSMFEKLGISPSLNRTGYISRVDRWTGLPCDVITCKHSESGKRANATTKYIVTQLHTLRLAGWHGWGRQ